MKASVIIPAKNGGERFVRTLDAVFGNFLEGGFEVIVIDSGSSDGTLEAVRSRPARLYRIPPRDFGHGRVRNYGAGLAEGEFLVFLSQDAVPASRDWLRNLTEPFGKDGKIAGVYGRQIPDGENLMETFFLLNTYGEEREVKSLSPRRRASPTPLRDIFFSNVNSAVRKEIWRSISFDERLNMSEDQDWSKRAMTEGYEIAYEPGAAVYHSHNYTLRTIFRRNYESGFSLRGITKERFLPALLNDVSYLAREVGYIRKTSGLRMVPYALAYELARHCGFIAGDMAARLGKKSP